MSIEETIKYLGLEEKEAKKDTENETVYDLSQKEYASIFTLLDKNESDWNEDSGVIDNSDESTMESHYYNKDENVIILKADLDKDTYTITFKEED